MKYARVGCVLVLVLSVLAACTSVAGGPVQDVASASGTPAPTETPTIVWFPPSTTPSPEHLTTPQPTAEKKPGIGDVLLTDDFASAAVWNTAASDQAAVTVTSLGLTIAAQPGIAPVASFRQGMIFTNMYAEITASPSLCRGADDYGLVFRAPNNVAYYRFSLACNGTTGADRISRGESRVLQPPLLSGDVPVGAPGKVRLGVWAVGSEFRFFLNGRYQFTADDKSYAAGAIGVFAQAAGTTPVIVTFSDLSVRSVTYLPTTSTSMP